MKPYRISTDIDLDSRYGGDVVLLYDTYEEHAAIPITPEVAQMLIQALLTYFPELPFRGIESQKES